MLVKVVSFYVVSGGGDFSYVIFYKDGFNVGIVFRICNGIIKIVIFFFRKYYVISLLFMCLYLCKNY